MQDTETNISMKCEGIPIPIPSEMITTRNLFDMQVKDVTSEFFNCCKGKLNTFEEYRNYI